MTHFVAATIGPRILRRWRMLLIAAPLALMACGGGGGGGGGSTQSGRAQIVITWPNRSKLIPIAANSITAVFKSGATAIASQVLARPTSGNQTTATFDNLKVGNLTLLATAYPNSDGTGVADATGTSPVTIVAGQTASVQVTMASTIDHLEVSPNTSPSVAVGNTIPFSVSAKDAAGAVVLIEPATIQWSSGDTALATIDGTGEAKGIAPTGATPGHVQINVTETESTKSASVQLAVTSNTTVSVTPASPTISVGDPKSFTATVANAPNTAVAWSVQEGASGGTISASGAYTAPALPGTYHVVATSNYDNSKTATAKVTVQAGNANVTIK